MQLVRVTGVYLCAHFRPPGSNGFLKATKGNPPLQHLRLSGRSNAILADMCSVARFTRLLTLSIEEKGRDLAPIDDKTDFIYIWSSDKLVGYALVLPYD